MWKLQKFSLTLFSQKFHASNGSKVDLLKKLLKSWFDELFFQWEKSFRFSTLCSVVISLVKPLLSRNFCEKSVRENFCNFHTVQIWRKIFQCDCKLVYFSTISGREDRNFSPFTLHFLEKFPKIDLYVVVSGLGWWFLCEIHVQLEKI